MTNREHVVPQGFQVVVDNPVAIYNYAISQIPFLTSPDKVYAFALEEMNSGSINTNDISFENSAFFEHLSETQLNGALFESEATNLKLRKESDGTPLAIVATDLHRSEDALSVLPHFRLPLLQRVSERMNGQTTMQLRFTGISAALYAFNAHPELVKANFGNPGFIDSSVFTDADRQFFGTFMGERILARKEKEALEGVRRVHLTAGLSLKDEESFKNDITGFAQTYERLMGALHSEAGVPVPATTVHIRSEHNLLTRLKLD